MYSKNSKLMKHCHIPAVLALWGKRLAAYRARQTAKRRTRKHITRRKVNTVAKPSPQLLNDQSDRIAEE